MSVVARLGHLVPSREGDGVTTPELFFDLVYVFAFTQVTTLMAHGEAPRSLVEGGVVLALLWWTWCSYAWLANHVRGDRGALRVALVAVMVMMFVACLAIPEAFHDGPGGLSGPVTLVVCYALVRLVHLGVYLAAAGEDRALRRQVLASLGASAIPASALLLLGALVGHGWQLPIWAGRALRPRRDLRDLPRGWRLGRRLGDPLLRAPCARRHPRPRRVGRRHRCGGLAGAGQRTGRPRGRARGAPRREPLVDLLTRAAERLEHGLAAESGQDRARMARDVFTYLHLPIVAGIVFAALGVEQATAHLDDDHLGATGAWALAIGLAAYLVGTGAAVRRAGGELLRWRLVAAFALLAGAVGLAAATPVVALAAAAALIVVVAVLEGTPAAPTEPAPS